MKPSVATDKPNKLLSAIIDSNIDYIFWALFILFSNPGGIFKAFDIWYITGKFNVIDLIFVLLSVCYILVPKKHDIFDLDFRKIRTYIILFAAYYFIFFVYIIPNLNHSKDYSLLTALIKSRWAIYSFLLFIYVYEFFKRKPKVFIKFFIYSSVIILFLFLLQTALKINILPTDVMNRGFVKINRIMLISDGFMYFLIPMGITIITFNLNVKNKKIILIGFVLMVLYYIIGLSRRYIMAVIIFFILAIFIYVLITGRHEALVKNTVKVVSLTIFIIIGTYIVFPKYVYAAGDSIVQTFNVFLYEKTTTGTKDVRMTLDRPFINEQFYNHPLFGTGFDNRWRTKAGDEQGYEALDYPFLSAPGTLGGRKNFVNAHDSGVP